MSLGDILMGVTVLLLCLVPLLGLVALTNRKQEGQKARVAGLLCGGGAVATLLVGYFSGSVMSLDNPTDHPVVVEVDGESHELPERSFTNIRVRGASVAVHTESDGKPIENVMLELDDHLGQTLFRSVIGDGRYIYTVCGANRFEQGNYSYK